jgi:hypothetical protein
MRKSQLRDIVKADNARRAARRIMEDAILGLDMIEVSVDATRIAANQKPGTYVNPCLVRGIGTINPPRNTSASDNCWNRGMKGKTVGVAPGTNPTEPTVLVHKNGKSTIVPAKGFGRTRNTRAVVRVARVADTATVNYGGQGKVD